MNFGLYATLYLLVVVGFFILALLVGLRHKSTVYRNFSYFAFLLGLWQLFQFGAQIIGHKPWSPVLLEMSVHTAAFMGLYFLVFAYAYSEKRLKFFPYYLLLAACAGALAYWSPGLSNATISREGISIESLDIFYVVPLIFAGTCTITGLGIIFSHMRKSRNHARKKQDRTLLLGVLQAAVLILAFSFLFPHEPSAQVAVPISCLISVVIIAYAMIYHKLFDIRFFVFRAATYLLVLFLVTLLFAVPLAAGITHLLGIHLTTFTFVLFVVGILGITYALQYLRELFTSLTNKVFYRYYYDPQEVLDSLSNVLVHTVDKDALCEQSSAIIRTALRPDFVGYLFFNSSDDRDRNLTERVSAAFPNEAIIVVDDLSQKHTGGLLGDLRKRGIALMVRLRTSHDDLGFLILGHKQSGETYTTRDYRLLSIASDEIAVGMQNSLRFEEIEQFNITLQEKIEDATKKLRQTNDKLLALDQTKDDFISMASHQLRTPLTSIKGYVSMVLEGDAGPTTSMQKKMLNQAFISSQRMVYLISDLLNVSRLKTGKFVIEPVQTNLAKVIQDEVEQLQETAKSRNLTLIYNKPQHFPTLMLDETKLRQVIMNFMDNAIYYTPQGGTITMNLVDKPLSIEFTVTDDGIGVPKHEQHHLFSKFYRAHNAKRARPDGTGLGLFMAKKVIVAQGGAIIFRSKEGHGSTFGFTFAKEKVSAAPDKQIVVSHDD